MSFAQVKRDHIGKNGGCAELYIDGVRYAPLIYAQSDIPGGDAEGPCSQKNVKNFAQCGINLVAIDVDLYLMWKQDGCDPTEILRQLGATLAVNPNAKIFVRLHLNPPYWWMRQNKQELIVFYGKESTDTMDYGDRVIALDATTEMKVSCASQKWLEDCSAMIVQMCQKVKAHPFGDALVGIQVAYGRCGEWHYFGNYDCAPTDEAAMHGDYSRPMTEFYRSYLRKKYQTEQALQAFYGQGATFDTVEQPQPSLRHLYRTQGRMLDPATEMPIIDNLMCFSLSCARAICRLCRAVKEGWGEGILAGSFYGYYFETGGASAAHLAPEEVFADPNVDFLAGPSAYTYNKYCGNMNLLRYLSESNRLAGKLFLCEMDQGYTSWVSSKREGYTCESEAQYAAVLKRNVMENILHGQGSWYYDHRLPIDSIYEKVGYWDNPQRLATITSIQKGCEALLERPFEKTTDVLLVNDTTTRIYRERTYRHFDAIDAIGKSGVGFDHIYLSDLQKCDLGRYKCVVFFACKVLTTAQLNWIRDNVMKDGRTVAFLEECGLIVDNVMAPDHMERLYGPAFAPHFIVKMPTCTVYHFDQVPYEASVYREMFRRAGAHIYTEDGEVVIADNALVMVHSKNQPRTVLHLPQGDLVLENCIEGDTQIIDIRTGQRIL